MKKLILGLITLGVLMSCEKEEVKPENKDIITNHVELTINSVQAMDSIKMIYNGRESLVRTLRDNDRYFSCNIYNNFIGSLEVRGDCNDNKFELIGQSDIVIITNGDIKVTYK